MEMANEEADAELLNREHMVLCPLDVSNSEAICNIITD